MGDEVWRSISYCDDCIHKEVCKYTKQVKEYENKAPVVSTVTGPTVAYSVRCRWKERRECYG